MLCNNYYYHINKHVAFGVIFLPGLIFCLCRSVYDSIRERRIQAKKMLNYLSLLSLFFAVEKVLGRIRYFSNLPFVQVAGYSRRFTAPGIYPLDKPRVRQRTSSACCSGLQQ